MDILAKVLLAIVLVWSNRITAAPRKPRLSLAAQSPSYFLRDVDGISGTYSFGYDVFDPETGNTQFRTEERYPNGTVIGSYGYIDPRGRSQRYDYVADENGYRILHGGPAKEEIKEHVETSSQMSSIVTEPSVSWSRPRKPYRKKIQILKTPSNYLETPHFTIFN